MTIRKVGGYGAGLGGNTFTGAQVAPSLAIGGATIGSNALAVTGTTLFNGDVTLSAGVNISGSSTSTSSGFATYVTISTGAFYWNTRSVLRASANGTFKLTTNAENIGGVIDVATDSTFKFFGRDGTTRAIMEGGTLALGGATIGSNALAVTGTAAISGATVISATGTALQLSATTPTLQIGSTNYLQIIYDGTTTDAATFRLSRDGASSDFIFRNSANIMARAQRVGSSGAAQFRLSEAVATPAGGTAGLGYTFGSTTNFGVFFGSGAPTLSAAKGSLYLRSDGTGVADRMYVNTDASTTWTAVATVA